MRFSLDTNILFYAVDIDAGYKHHLAADILERAALGGNCILTAQSLGELFHATTRKGVMSSTDARHYFDYLTVLFPLASYGVESLSAAMAAVERKTFSFWDALLLATAGRAGCRTVISEDMAHGSTMEGVRVVHPFAGESLSEEVEALISNKGGRP